MKLIIDNLENSEFCEFPIKKIMIDCQSNAIKDMYLNLVKTNRNIDAESYVITYIFIDKNYTEDHYYALGTYFNFEGNRKAKIKLDNNKEIMIYFDRILKIYRPNITDKPKIAFATFKLKEEL